MSLVKMKCIVYLAFYKSIDKIQAFAFNVLLRNHLLENFKRCPSGGHVLAYTKIPANNILYRAGVRDGKTKLLLGIIF